MGTRTPSKAKPVVTTSALVTSLGSEATAIGQDTLAVATADCTISDKGSITKAKGTVTASAIAQAGNEDLTYATAYTFAEIDGADRFKTKTKTTFTIGESDGQTTVIATSVTKFHAMVKGPGENAKLPEQPTMSSPEHDAASWPIGGAIDGNVAAFDVQAQAYGENSYVGVDTTALAIEDQMSTVSVLVITGVDWL